MFSGNRRFTPLALSFSLFISACDRENAEPKVPLGGMAARKNGVAHQGNELSEAARAALERGNNEYRAARYDAALQQYAVASREAPGNAAPYFGILMAAQKLGKMALADSASRMIRRLSPEKSPPLLDSSLTSIHRSAAREAAKP